MWRQLLDKYEAGTCTEAEKALVETWYANLDDPAIREEMTSLDEADKKALRSTMWQAIEEQLPVATEPAPTQVLFSSPTRRRVATLWKVAAVFLFLLLSGGAVLHWYGLDSTPVEISSGEQQWQEVISPKGKKAQVTLADGSKVYLNAGSKLIYPLTFAAGRREVVLEGEAFFEVQKDPSRPFSVQSGELVTMVLGTSFNVKAYPDSKHIRVAVLTGRVTVKRLNQMAVGEKDLLLLPNEAVTYHTASQKIWKEEVMALREAGWKNGLLILNHPSFEESVRELERWYGVKILLESEALRHRQVAASFERAPLAQVMRTLSLSLQFDYVIQGDTVRIK